ncbi:MAG: hypothetical protein JO051_06345 [Acidobacteriaceae bacterium]|nr:hypothetical protein [Acidobacteriaceae bacterium]
MSKQDEAGLILKLYELRREEQMRKAREWYFREFNPQSLDEFHAAMFSDKGAHVRQVVSYWDMAAALVNSGAISLELFNRTNQEHIGVFAAIEPLLEQIRAAYTPSYAENLEKLIDDTPNGRVNVARMRDTMKQVRARIQAKQQQSGAAV